MLTNTPFKNSSSTTKMSVYAFDGKNRKLIHFGAKGYSDFTMHQDTKRKESYIARHEGNEDWTKSGVLTAGFWSRWVLWNKPSLKDSISDVRKRFKLVTVNV